MEPNKQILLSSQDSRAAVRQLYAEYRELHPNASLTTMGKKIGVKGKGYLSESFGGKQFFALKHRYAVGKALGLDPVEIRYLALLIEKDHEKDLHWKKHFDHELQMLAKTWRVEKYPSQEGNLLSDPLLFELVAIFGLFQNKVTHSELTQYFGSQNESRIFTLLNQLKQFERIEEAHGVYSLKQMQGALDGDSFKRINIDSIKQGLKQAGEELEYWYSQPEEAYFRSTFVSVKRTQYQKLLDNLVQSLDEWEVKVESNEADEIIRLGVQAFPSSRPSRMNQMKES